ncbi:MAG: tryptophan 7-halogenase [Balneolaceae bacterium]|nr:tryptophan 7-halogenase [Balneolaceae bacterium]
MNETERDQDTFDFLIAGSGFAGSITAMCLKQAGYRVCIIERKKHPRFSVGESSTPIADMILRNLSETYDLPFLKELSRYGSWQKYHPELVCGLKRGFSYYPHQPGKAFLSDKNHSNELLVAASYDDENSDTNWLRSDVDQFLADKALNVGITLHESAEIQTIERDPLVFWNIYYQKNGEVFGITSKWIIDATGSPHFSGKFFGTKSSSDSFDTNSSAIYSHFEGVGKWHDYLNRNDFITGDYPYSPDDSALHQLIDEGWVWMLRFNNDLLSAGIVIDNHTHEPLGTAAEYWEAVMQRYPSLSRVFRDAKLAEVPGIIIQSGRLQRKLDKSFGEGWIALSHTFGFVDPLHSTGIAYSLAGVERVLSIIEAYGVDKMSSLSLQLNQEYLCKELKLIDKLVSVSYLTRNNFKLFTASVMLYFIASIKYEQSRLRGEIPNAFLCADDPELRTIIEETHHEILNLKKRGFPAEDVDRQVETIRKRIEPYNSAGLMDSNKNNMYRHTAVEL